MLIDFQQVLTSYDGSTIYEPETVKDGAGNPVMMGNGPMTRNSDRPMTLGFACFRALEYGGDDRLAGEKKAERFAICARIYNADGPVEMRAEEISMIKKLIGEVWPMQVVGAAFPLLDASDATPARANGKARPAAAARH